MDVVITDQSFSNQFVGFAYMIYMIYDQHQVRGNLTVTENEKAYNR